MRTWDVGMRATKHAVRGAGGFTMVEVLVAAAIFTLIGVAMGSLYVSTRDSLESASAEAYVQRTGTLIEEELKNQISRARLLQVAHCRPTGSVTIPAGKSIMYEVLVQNSTSSVMESQIWCVYEHQNNLWRCPIAALSPPQDCTSTSQNLTLYTQRAVGTATVRVSDTSFALATITCGSPPGPCAITTSLNIRFSLDARDAQSGVPLTFSPRMFAFNTTIRN